MNEYNINTLKSALAKLPDYDAPRGIWASIEEGLQEDGLEKNRATLHKTLAILPQYSPPYELWESIAEALDTEEQLSQDAQRLRQYAAPGIVWKNLADALDKQSNASMKARVSLITRYAAAAIICISLASIWLTSRPGTKAEQIVVTQQQLDDEVAEIIQEEDPAFNMVETLCQERVPVCQKPEFKALKTELDELTEAKEALRLALGNYGDDATLSSQLVKIERERSALLKQMIQMI